jgi:hypothetical protein
LRLEKGFAMRQIPSTGNRGSKRNTAPPPRGSASGRGGGVAFGEKFWGVLGSLWTFYHNSTKPAGQSPPETKGLPVKVDPSGALVATGVARVARGGGYGEGGGGARAARAAGVAAAVMAAAAAAAKATAAAEAVAARKLASAERRGQWQGGWRLCSGGRRGRRGRRRRGRR